MSTPIRFEIVRVCAEFKELLLVKNEAYGNSVGDPLAVFSKLDAEERLAVRLDDKLSRIARGEELPDEDTLVDLTGYLILLLAIRGTSITERISQASLDALREKLQATPLPPEVEPALVRYPRFVDKEGDLWEDRVDQGWFVKTKRADDWVKWDDSNERIVSYYGPLNPVPPTGRGE